MLTQERHFQDRTIFPVILPVAAEAHEMMPRDRVKYLSRYARRALKGSAAKSSVTLGPLEKDGNGVPQPFEGIFWSIAHKPDYVAGVVAPQPIGIDVEKIRPCSQALFKKTATDQEWALPGSNAERAILFFRYWTAKEAVLKACGTGLTDLSKCRIVALHGNISLTADYQNRSWQVEHYFFADHVASVVTLGFKVVWTVSKRC